MSDLEAQLDNRSIRTNGIPRSFGTPQKLRSAYRDLKEEVGNMTDGTMNLDYIMRDYRAASDFYCQNLSRRAYPEDVAASLLLYCYPPYRRQGLGAARTAVFQQVVDRSINVPFLILMLLKAVPSYKSKSGDVVGYGGQFLNVISFIERVTSGDVFDHFSAIRSAKEEPNKTRLMLLHHVTKILNIYMLYSCNDFIYDASNDLKSSSVGLDIVGYWNTDGGGLETTDFYRIEYALRCGYYFLVKCHKAGNRLEVSRFTMVVSESLSGNLIFNIIHPESSPPA